MAARRTVKAMSSSLAASEADICRLAAIVTARREDPAEGLPPSLLSDLMDQIRCDAVAFQGMDSGRQGYWFHQDFPADDAGDELAEAVYQGFWQQYWDSAICSYPDRTGDLRSVLTVPDFYSARQ